MPSPSRPLRIGALVLLLLSLPIPGPAGPVGPLGPVGAVSPIGTNGPIAPRVAPPLHGAIQGRLQGTSLRYGLLWLDVDPAGAHIALDGEFLDAGVWLISMAPGLHDLAVRKDGFSPWNRRIGIGPGENLRISVRLERDSGK